MPVIVLLSLRKVYFNEESEKLDKYDKINILIELNKVYQWNIQELLTSREQKEHHERVPLSRESNG